MARRLAVNVKSSVALTVWTVHVGRTWCGRVAGSNKCSRNSGYVGLTVLNPHPASSTGTFCVNTSELAVSQHALHKDNTALKRVKGIQRPLSRGGHKVIIYLYYKRHS